MIEQTPITNLRRFPGLLLVNYFSLKGSQMVLTNTLRGSIGDWKHLVVRTVEVRSEQLVLELLHVGSHYDFQVQRSAVYLLLSAPSPRNDFSYSMFAKMKYDFKTFLGNIVKSYNMWN